MTLAVEGFTQVPSIWFLFSDKFLLRPSVCKPAVSPETLIAPGAIKVTGTPSELSAGTASLCSCASDPALLKIVWSGKDAKKNKIKKKIKTTNEWPSFPILLLGIGPWGVAVGSCFVITFRLWVKDLVGWLVLQLGWLGFRLQTRKWGFSGLLAANNLCKWGNSSPHAWLQGRGSWEASPSRAGLSEADVLWFIRVHQGCLAAGANSSPSRCLLEFQLSAYLATSVIIFTHTCSLSLEKEGEFGKGGDRELTC